MDFLIKNDGERIEECRKTMSRFSNTVVFGGIVRDEQVDEVFTRFLSLSDVPVATKKVDFQD